MPDRPDRVTGVLVFIANNPTGVFGDITDTTPICQVFFTLIYSSKLDNMLHTIINLLPKVGMVVLLLIPIVTTYNAIKNRKKRNTTKAVAPNPKEDSNEEPDPKEDNVYQQVHHNLVQLYTEVMKVAYDKKISSKKMLILIKGFNQALYKNRECLDKAPVINASRALKVSASALYFVYTNMPSSRYPLAEESHFLRFKAEFEHWIEKAENALEDKPNAAKHSTVYCPPENTLSKQVI